MTEKTNIPLIHGGTVNVGALKIKPNQIVMKTSKEYSNQASKRFMYASRVVGRGEFL